MFKAKASFDVKIGERVYQFICENDSPLAEVSDVLSLVQKNVQKLLDDAKKKEDESKCEEKVEG